MTISSDQALSALAVRSPTPVPPAGPADATGNTDYGALLAIVRAAGLLDRRRGYYAVKMLSTLLFMAVGWAAFAFVGNSWWQLLVAAGIAFATGQSAYLGHDAGHRQMFTGKRGNRVAGLVFFDFIVGVSVGWWVDKHNQHHSHPNHVELDPDVSVKGLAFTLDQARAKRGIARFITRHQAILILPLFCFEGLSTRVASVRALARGGIRGRTVEGVLLVAHTVVFAGVVILFLPLGKALAFLAVHEAVGGFYMGISFAPNHKGMPLVEDEEGTTFMQRQVLTSRNISGGRIAHFLLGGLNLQIEHHLFPTMPRANLLRAQRLVKPFCEQAGLLYQECSFLRSHWKVLEYFHDTGAPLRGPAKTVS